jgi:poly(ADP-ribose) glycohydrolase ARH3
MTEDRYAGSMLGLALADARGAAFEGGLVGGLVWRILGGGAGGKLHWTDDTQMAVGLAESLLECGGLDADRLAARWARDASWTRGYGPGAFRLLAMIRSGADWRTANRAVFPDGSFGNGAAMRAGPLGLFYSGDSRALRGAATLASSITHAHPLGIEGGMLMARAVDLALTGGDPGEFLSALASFVTRREYLDRIETVRSWLGRAPDYAEVRRKLGNTVRAHESAVTAVHAALRFPGDFEGMMEFIIRLGGDTDTIGAMAGSIFGAWHGAGALPPGPLARLEERGRIAELGKRLYRCSARPCAP